MVNPLYGIFSVLFKSSGSMIQIVTTLKYWKFWLPLFIILTSFAIEFGFLFIAFTETGDPIPIAKELGRKTFAIDNKILIDTTNLVNYRTDATGLFAPIFFGVGFLALTYQVFADFVMIWFLFMICHWLAKQVFGNTNSPVIIYTVVGLLLLFLGMLEVIYCKLFDDIWILPMSGITESIWILISAFILPHIEKPIHMIENSTSS